MPFQKILGSLSPLFTVSRITGFSLFTIDTSRQQPQIKFIDIIFIFLTIITNTLINVSFMLSHYDPGIHGIAVMKFSLPILMYVNHLGNIFGMLWLFINRKRITKILTVLAEIDEILMKTGERIDHKRNRFRLRILVNLPILTVGSLSFSCGLFHGVNHFRLDMLLQIFAIWIFIGTFVMYSHLIVGVTGIAQRFAKIPKISAEICPQNLKHLQKIQEIHLKIADSVGIFNKIYGPLMTFYFGNSFCWLCISVFALAMYPDVNRSTVCTLMCIVIHCIITIGTCFFIVKIAEYVARIRKKLIRNSYELVVKFHGNTEFCGRVLQFQSQLMDVKLVFSCGFFDINWKFVFQVRILFS